MDVSTSHTRHAYVEELQLLEHELLQMAARADAMVGSAVDAISSLDEETAMQVLRSDDEIDAIDLEIEQRCLRLLALQQPAASDLRTIGTAMKMITDLERVGDLAVGIAKCAMKIEKELGTTAIVDFRLIANEARRTLREAMQAFVKRDPDAARHVAKLEEEVDRLYRDLRGQLHDYMRHHPADVVPASWMLLALHHIERVSDHALNIAERVVFVVTGQLTPLKSDFPVR